ncbi:MAG: hypothetical protein VZR36_08915 [Prevotella sp.]|nr:hypothetical protein [Prevotella sp.]
MVDKIFDNKYNVVNGINDGLIALRKRYNESGDYGYAQFEFAILGDDVLDAACEEFPDLRDRISVDTWPVRPAKMAKFIAKAKITIAEFVHCYTFKYYMSKGCNTDTSRLSKEVTYMQTLIRTKDGQLLFPYFHSAPSDLKAGFYLYNDKRDYYRYETYDFKCNVKEPSRTAALTDKKLQQWIDYLNAKAKDCDDNKAARENNAATTIQRLIDEIDPDKCDTYNVNGLNSAGYVSGGKIVANNIKLVYYVTAGVIRFELGIDKNCPDDYIDLFKQMTGTAKK